MGIIVKMFLLIKLELKTRATSLCISKLMNATVQLIHSLSTSPKSFSFIYTLQGRTATENVLGNHAPATSTLMSTLTRPCPGESGLTECMLSGNNITRFHIRFIYYGSLVLECQYSFPHVVLYMLKGTYVYMFLL